MAREFAVKFRPQADGDLVAMDTYIRTLQALFDGWNSLRRVTAPLIAEHVKWPTATVRDALEIAVGPTETGSLTVPVVLGVGRPAILDDGGRVATMFWRYSARLLKTTAARGNALADVPGSCAESFVKAARSAREGRCRLELVERGDPHRAWRPTADLTDLEDGLGRYAERRALARPTSTRLIGRLLSLSWDPPGFALDTGTEKRSVSMPARLREDAHALWGREVMVDVEAKLTADGEIRETPRALAIAPVAKVDDLGADFERSFGARRETWDTPEAAAYLNSLRRPRRPA